MEITQSETLHDLISRRGLSGLLYQVVSAERPGVSRNTIHLALKFGGTTPLRRFIIDEAYKLLSDEQPQKSHLGN